MALYLKNATVVDWRNFEVKRTSIRVDEGTNGGIEFVDQVPEGDDKILDCTGKIVTRAFGCGHHHIYSALARGMPAPRKIPKNFHQILQYVWWTLDKCLDLEIIEASALSTALYCAKNGVTFVIDHHASPMAIENSLSTIAKAFDKVGVSHLLCYEMSDRDGEDIGLKGLEETRHYLAQGNQALVGLHASFTVGNNLLEKAVELAKQTNSGLHVHVAEDPIDQETTLKNYRKRVIPRFHDTGALDLPKTILSHCLHLNNDERLLVRDSAAYIVQNTESNLNNNVGLFYPENLGDRILLGTDGMHSDMLRSAKAAYFVGQGTEGISPEGMYRRFRRIHQYLNRNSIPGDGENNLVILDYNSPTPVTQQNFPGHFIYGIDSSHIQSVIANGRLIVQNQKLLTADQDEILAFSHQMAQKLWSKMKEKS